MPLSKQQFQVYIQELQFKELFNELGWNKSKSTLTVIIDETAYELQAAAEKSGFKILVCPVADLPHTPLVKKLDTQIRKLFHHYILICHDSAGHQKWVIPVQKTEGRDIVSIDYAKHQAPEFLFQKISHLSFSFEKEDKLTIVDVNKLVNENFIVNSEKITKQFYEQFKKEHVQFRLQIHGIDDSVSRDWYTSLILNRLMFCYFIQKKGFLDNNKNYLGDKLKESMAKKGKNKFYSFYRNFLLALFHRGLGSPERDKVLKDELGNIPYLNGGLFDEHELEKSFKEIQIDDKAFERLFNFFDQYQWHLDTRQTASGKDINPDVLGYIFEKYINDRAQMGAYYTKEDITDYISKNCIIPFLFDKVKKVYPKALASDGPVWQACKNSGTHYIYDAVKKGVELPLPDEIAIGLDTTKPGLLERRKEWNKPSPEQYALPTEIWREVVERRNRFNEIKEKIETGQITEINDFITYNLNIRLFAQDVIEQTDDPELIKHFYKAINSITILDPTCGSGAFLFAALNILEPLYEACIEKMTGFVKANPKKDFKFFKGILEQINNPAHPNQQYFIYKNIILNNLYGVDIMNEAVEIAKLRLFLKMVAAAEVNYKKPNLGLEPLPDIDFNIRTGNSLVGFATEKELDNFLSVKFDFDEKGSKLKEKCDVVAKAFNRYKEIQLTTGDTHNDFKSAKAELLNLLGELNSELNKLFHSKTSKLNFNEWLITHQPFHWFAEFYEIIYGFDGFDIIVGNPPYVEFSKVRDLYQIYGYTTEKCSNLYAFTIERGLQVVNPKGKHGFIVPLSAFCTQRMDPLVTLYRTQKFDTWVGHFGWRPATLFNGVNIPLSIIISQNTLTPESPNIWSTEFYKWQNETREFLTSLVIYNSINKLWRQTFVIPKIGLGYNSIFQKINTVNSSVERYLGLSGPCLYYRNTGGLYWRIILDFAPNFTLNGKRENSSTLEKLYFKQPIHVKIVGALLNSNLFWLNYVAYSSFHHVNPIDLSSFPVDIASIDKNLIDALVLHFDSLMQDLDNKSKMQTRIHKGGNHSVSQTFYPSLSKKLVDDLDKLIAQYYGFSEEELDKIINYDIKYRIGKDLAEENGE